ncbi:MAG: hypothetical protein JW917_08270 [Ignavibacteria bacterium]|nr:hypothetical protein [Ignavibacteria bacterium]
MRKLIFLLAIIICSFQIVKAQSGWFSVTTPINDLELRKIQFTAGNTGYAIGDVFNFYSCYLLKTTSGGNNRISRSDASRLNF